MPSYLANEELWLSKLAEATSDEDDKDDELPDASATKMVETNMKCPEPLKAKKKM